jgi:hypothetical protein
MDETMPIPVIATRLMIVGTLRSGAHGFRSQVAGAPTLNAEEVVDRRAMRFHGGGTALPIPVIATRLMIVGTLRSGVTDKPVNARGRSRHAEALR